MEDEELISLADTLELDDFAKELVARFTETIDYVAELEGGGGEEVVLAESA
jgi:hypothetical protein